MTKNCIRKTCQSFYLLFVSLIISCIPAAEELPPGDPDNGGLVLPEGFEAVVVADSLGKARHLAVSEEGNIYIKLRRLHQNRFGNVVLKDWDNDGKADTISYFGEYPSKGTLANGMTIHQDYLYFSSELVLYRQKLEKGKLVPETPLDTVLIDDHEHGNHWHITKPVAFDDQGKMYVPFGSPSNACQDLVNSPGGKPGVAGLDPCPELLQHGGIWQFPAGKTNLTQADGVLYATGIRSVVGLTWNPDDRQLYAVMHGRDDLFMLFPQLYTRWQSAVLPAEELLQVQKGDNYGWPYCYFDQMTGKNMLAPEYGGNGEITSERCDTCDLPLMGFPGHWAPNDLLFYRGNQFPERYKKGVFIAFHGSTNRSPYPQAGYFVAFIPFEGGAPNDSWEVFADGFAQVDTIVSTGNARYRPMGLTTGPDGSIYITDSNVGRLWRVMYKGDRRNFSDNSLLVMEKRKSLPHLRTPDETEDNLQRKKTTAASANYDLYCAPCHQRNGEGAGGRFPPLTDPAWINDTRKLAHVVLHGLNGPITVNGEEFHNSMPSFSFLDDRTVADILTYVRANFGHKAPPVSEDVIAGFRRDVQ